MAATVRGQRSDCKIVMAKTGAFLLEPGDLLFQETDDVRPFSEVGASIAELGSEPLNQQYAAARFAGVCEVGMASADTGDVLVDANPLRVWTFTCPSDTWEVGDLVGPSEDSGNDDLEDQVVEKVTNVAEAIGRCAERVASAATTVKVVLFSAVAGFRGLLTGGVSLDDGINVQTLAATLTLTALSPRTQILDPGGAARTVTLPAEAEAISFLIVNAGDGDEPLTVNNDAGTKQALIERHGSARFVSDGTSWFVHATSTDHTAEVNVETLAATKTGAAGDASYQILDPGGADRIYNLPTEAVGIGLGPIMIFNAADADETITVNEDSGTTAIAILDRGNFAIVICDGTSWRAIGGNQHTPAVSVATLAGQLALDGTSQLYQVLDPGGADRDVLLPAEATAKGRGIYQIVNTADADEVLSVKEDSDTTVIAYLRRSEYGHFVSDGTNWHLLARGYRTGTAYGNRVAETLAADRVLTDLDAQVQVLSPNGSNRNVDLPAAAGTNTPFVISHGDGANDLIVRLTGAGATVVTISTAESALLIPDGTGWINGSLAKAT